MRKKSVGIVLKSVKAMKNIYRGYRFFTMEENVTIHSNQS